MAVPMAPETLLLSWGFHIISKEESDIYWLLQTGHVHCALSHCSKYAEWNMWLLSHGNTSTESPALKSSKQLPYQTKDVYYTFQFLGWTSYMFSLWSVISPSIFPVILHELHVPSSQTCCRNLSYNIHVSAVAYQMAPTCIKQMNLLHFADIQLILYWVIA